jgi:maleylacetoacetate isomerase
MMRFYGYWRSSAAYRCRIALGLKGVDYEFRSVHLRRNGGEQKQPDYLALNPQGLVPALATDQGVISQSLAIIEWLDETVPEPPLMPSSPFDRAQVRAFAQIIACDIHPLQNLRVLEYLKSELACDQSAADAWCRKWIEDGLSACESLLARQKSPETYCFGTEPGLADICLAPQLYSARRFGADLKRMGRLAELERAYSAHPAFVAAHPDAQPDKDV